MNKQTNIPFLFLLFCIISSNASWKFLRLGNSAWDFIGLNFGPGIFVGFVWSPRDFLSFWLLPLFDHPHHWIPPPTDPMGLSCWLSADQNWWFIFLFSEVNPLDYVCKSIGCQIELLDHNSEECQLILEYIHNSSEHISLFYYEITACS